MATQRAVCVGINYPGTSAALNGCVNDAHDWAELLTNNGYEVVQLLDDSATKTNIVLALTVAISGMKRGDRLVFTYSGHGTWVYDTDGDEDDKRDEALVPIDYATGGLITDDEIQDIFSAVPYGASSLIISDSCHSGTMARNLVGAVTPARGVPRFLSPSVVEGMPEHRAALLEETRGVKSPRKTSSLISGCMDHEFSYDAVFDNRPNGALTRAAIDSFEPGVRLNTWYKRITSKLPSPEYPQSPQLTAASAYRRYKRAI